MKEKFKELIDRVKEATLPIAIGVAYLGINVIGSYYTLERTESRGGKTIASGIEGIHKGSPQIQPWLTVWDIDGDGTPDSTDVKSVFYGGGTFARRRKATQAERDWYTSQK